MLRINRKGKRAHESPRSGSYFLDQCGHTYHGNNFALCKTEVYNIQTAWKTNIHLLNVYFTTRQVPKQFHWSDIPLTGQFLTYIKCTTKVLIVPPGYVAQRVRWSHKKRKRKENKRPWFRIPIKSYIIFCINLSDTYFHFVFGKLYQDSV